MPRHHRKTGRKTRKGGSYGFSGALSTGAANWTKTEEVPPLAGGRRKKKGGKKTRSEERRVGKECRARWWSQY